MDEDDKPHESDYLRRAFITPADYVVPPESELRADTRHPELLARTYRYNVYQNPSEPKDFLPVFTHIDCTQNLFVVATNHYTSPIFHGNIIGATDFEPFIKKDFQNACFHAGGAHHITGLKCLDETTVSVTVITFQLN